MKIIAAILILVTGIFAKSAAQTAGAPRSSPSSLEIILNFQEVGTYGTNTFISDQVEFSAATNITMRITFRNVGDMIMNRMDLLSGFSVILDGKEYKETRWNKAFSGIARFDPKEAWRMDFPLSGFLIPKEALAPGRHTVAVKDADSESNIVTIFIDTQK